LQPGIARVLEGDTGVSTRTSRTPANSQLSVGALSVRRSNVIDVYVGYLRAKGDRPFGGHSIVTVRGGGYRLDPAAS